MAKSLYRAFIAGITTQMAWAGLIKEDTATKTLVLLDDWATIETHSMFLKHIQEKLGHEVEFAMAEQGPSGKV